ncbi:unnamed protein product [Gulo gulo]|uniref:Uncharacterized protein n=1 Tax=Gulo gulo TaxID=48420 RepID=A0A9X9LR12_GULGU|nr:unnamed protein product [Gulo gulo]
MGQGTRVAVLLGGEPRDAHLPGASAAPRLTAPTPSGSLLQPGTGTKTVPQPPPLHSLSSRTPPDAAAPGPPSSAPRRVPAAWAPSLALPSLAHPLPG